MGGRFRDFGLILKLLQGKFLEIIRLIVQGLQGGDLILALLDKGANNAHRLPQPLTDCGVVTGSQDLVLTNSIDGALTSVMDLVQNLAQFRPVEDNAEAHKMLRVTNLHWGKRKIQRTWRGMCYIMLRLEVQEPTRENIRTYQAEKLGRFGGNTLLTELMPIPKPKVKRWDYVELMHQFASREEYYRTVKPRRIHYLQALIKEHRPKVAVSYGKAFWSDYRQLFEGSVFELEGLFQTAVLDDTLAILTGHFAGSRHY